MESLLAPKDFHHKRKRDRGDHTVQFYETDEFLCAAVSVFLMSALQNKEGVILVATSEHLQAIEERVLSLKIDVNNFKNSGQLTFLDAQETLDKFMVKHLPVPEKYFALMDEVVGKKLTQYPQLKVYGEMVNLLWSEGNFDGTIALEQLWN